MIASTRYVQVAGGRVYVEEWGEGKTILCLHGLGGGAYFFLALAARLRHRHRVISLDLPGSGLSPAIPSITFDALADLVVEFSRTLQLSELCLIGHSMGTIIGLETLRRAQKLATHFIAVGGLPEPLESARERIASRANSVLQSGMRGHGREIVEANVSARTLAERAELTGLLMRLYEVQPADGYVATAETLVGWTARPLPPLDGVRCLAITGEEDRYAPPEAVRRFVEQLPAGTCVEVMRDCGHLPFLEQPERFAEIVERFLAEP